VLKFLTGRFRRRLRHTMSISGVADTLRREKELVEEGIFHYHTRDEVPKDIAKYYTIRDLIH
jgi:hypothetical protein